MMCECQAERRVLEIYDDVVETGTVVCYEDDNLFRYPAEYKIVKEICTKCKRAYLIKTPFPVEGAIGKEISWEELDE